MTEDVFTLEMLEKVKTLADAIPKRPYVRQGPFLIFDDDLFTLEMLDNLLEKVRKYHGASLLEDLLGKPIIFPDDLYGLEEKEDMPTNPLFKYDPDKIIQGEYDGILVHKQEDSSIADEKKEDIQIDHSDGSTKITNIPQQTVKKFRDQVKGRVDSYGEIAFTGVKGIKTLRPDGSVDREIFGEKEKS